MLATILTLSIYAHQKSSLALAMSVTLEISSIESEMMSLSVKISRFTQNNLRLQNTTKAIGFRTIDK